MPAPAVKPAVKRTRYTNGIALPRVADGRSLAAKRFRTLVKQFAHDLGGGDLSAADQSLIRQAAHLQLEAEKLQMATIAGDRVDADSLIRINSEARRVIGMLQAKAAKARPSAPDLQEWIAQNHGQGGESA
jgi:hypothetical protein